jgi:hypothetical protein
MMGTMALLILLAWLVATAIMTVGAARIAPEQLPGGASSARHSSGPAPEPSSATDEC